MPGSFHLPTLPSLLAYPDQPLIHRDLSWLQFNDRVLAESRARTNPLLKRLKFLAISASNLDEFFMIRIASLQRSIAAVKEEEKRRSLQRIEDVVLRSVERFGKKQARTFQVLQREFSSSRVFIHRGDAKDSPGFALGKRLFEGRVLPVLERRSRFRFENLLELGNLQLLIYVSDEIWYQVPRGLPSVFSELGPGDEVHFYFLDELILRHLPGLLSVKEKPVVLRVTRDSDFTADLGAGDSESVPDLVRSSLRSREKGRFVRLQYNGALPAGFLEASIGILRLDSRQVYRAPFSLCLSGLFSVANSAPERFRIEKKYDNPRLEPMVPPSFRDMNRIFQDLDTRDFLLHHPYDSYDCFLRWLAHACDDPHVVMIEQTIYRTDSSPVLLDALKRAARTKKIRVVLELRARFDEANNLQLADELGKAGVEVAFGFGTLKLHAKITLVTRREGGVERRYVHLSTGNYHSRTARQYTDLAIFTSHQDIGADARHFFDSVIRKTVPNSFGQLIVAPTRLHQKIRSLIREEKQAALAGKRARIIAKVNALVDEKVIDDLYQASQAGVRVDLIVRGACSLVPGVKGLSDNIRVVSIVDRFLEHSRIYYFEHSRAMYLSSADWMPRNFFSRLEIAFPVLDERIFNYIAQVLLPAYLKDSVKAKRLSSRGNWVKTQRPRGAPVVHAQAYFAKLARNGYRGTPLE